MLKMNIKPLFGLFLFFCIVGNAHALPVADFQLYPESGAAPLYACVSDLSYVDQSYVAQAGGIMGSGDDQFTDPYDVWGDGTYIYIADSSNDRVVKRYASNLTYVAQVGSEGSGNDQFHVPCGICGDETYIYIADTWNHRVVKRYASNLTYVAQVGSEGSGNDQFYFPAGIFGDGTYIYIADDENYRIVKRYASNLTYVAQVGSEGSGNDQFENPQGIWGDGTCLYIADMGNDRIVKRQASDLSYVTEIQNDEQFEFPSYVCGDGTYLYVIDHNWMYCVAKYRLSDLSYMGFMGRDGSGDGELDGACGMWADETYLYIADTRNHRVVKCYASDLDDIIVSWSWDFDGDGIEDENIREPDYMFWDPGTYAVTLTVTTSYDLTATKTVSTTISSQTSTSPGAGTSTPAEEDPFKIDDPVIPAPSGPGGGSPATVQEKPLIDQLRELLGIGGNENVNVSDLLLNPPRRDTYFVQTGLQPVQYATYKYDTNRVIESCEVTGIQGATCTILSPDKLEISIPVTACAGQLRGTIHVQDVLGYAESADVIVRVIDFDVPGIVSGIRNMIADI